MKTIPYRCDDTRHKALLGAARSTGTSVQRLFDNFVTHVITERQAEARFLIRQKRGDPARVGNCWPKSATASNRAVPSRRSCRSAGGSLSPVRHPVRNSSV